jgi:hypothetical protein
MTFVHRNSVSLLTYMYNYFVLVCAPLLPMFLHQLKIGYFKLLETAPPGAYSLMVCAPLISIFLHQLKIDYFKQLNMWTVGNSITSTFDIVPASGYNMELSYLFIVFFLFLYKLSVNTNNYYEDMILLIFNNIIICFMTFEIKISHKWLKF